MASNVSVQHGEILYLDEILKKKGSLRGKSVRAMGRISEYELESGLATIEQRGAALRVDTTHIVGPHLRVGSLFQFIGELEAGSHGRHTELVLRARVGRNVDGLDEAMYDRALALRRHFEEAHVHMK